MELGIAGRKAVVLAATRGMGFAIARSLVQEGVDVTIVGRNPVGVRDAVQRLTADAGGNVGGLEVDLSDPDAAKRISQGVGEIDILVNNTPGPPPGPISTVTGDTWRTQFDGMAARLFEITSMLLPGMRERRWGRVLTLASSGAIQPIDNLGISNTLRAGIVAWSKTLSNEVASSGVTANVLIPGRIRTERLEEIDAANAKRQGVDVATIEKRSIATIPAGRYGTVEDYADVATFLVSERAAYITGSTVRCDGGIIRST